MVRTVTCAVHKTVCAVKTNKPRGTAVHTGRGSVCDFYAFYDSNKELQIPSGCAASPPPPPLLPSCAASAAHRYVAITLTLSPAWPLNQRCLTRFPPQGCTAVIAGPSGAGKSSLINALRFKQFQPGAAPTPAGHGSSSTPAEQASSDASCSRHDHEADRHRLDEVEDEDEGSDEGEGGDGDVGPDSGGGGGGLLQVGGLTRIGRGAHTTRNVTLLPLPGGGLLADTPGFNLPSLAQVSSRDLWTLFPEMVRLVEDAGGQCRYKDCMHLKEPGCAVNSAPLDRYQFYLKFLDEVKGIEALEMRSRQGKEEAVRFKVGKGGEQRAEARLNNKKYRSAARRTAKQQRDTAEERASASERRRY